MQMQMGMDGGEEDHAQALKRPRLVWTPPLHKRFVDAVAHVLGERVASKTTACATTRPSRAARVPPPSHLQKYRLYLKRLQGCSESTMENSPSREGGGSGGGSDGARPGGPRGSGNGSGNGSGSEGDGDGGSGKGNGFSERGIRAGNSGNGSGNGSDGEPSVNKAPGAGTFGNSAGAGAKGIQSSDAAPAGRPKIGRGLGGEVAGAAGEGAAAEAEGAATRAHRASVVRGTRVLGRWVRGRQRRRTAGALDAVGAHVGVEILGRRASSRRRERAVSRRRRGARSRTLSSPRIRAALYVCTARGLAFGRVGSTRSNVFHTRSTRRQHRVVVSRRRKSSRWPKVDRAGAGDHPWPPSLRKFVALAVSSLHARAPAFPRARGSVPPRLQRRQHGFQIFPGGPASASRFPHRLQSSGTSAYAPLSLLACSSRSSRTSPGDTPPCRTREAPRARSAAPDRPSAIDTPSFVCPMPA